MIGEVLYMGGFSCGGGKKLNGNRAGFVSVGVGALYELVLVFFLRT